MTALVTNKKKKTHTVKTHPCKNRGGTSIDYCLTITPIATDTILGINLEEFRFSGEKKIFVTGFNDKLKKKEEEEKENEKTAVRAAKKKLKDIKESNATLLQETNKQFVDCSRIEDKLWMSKEDKQKLTKRDNALSEVAKISTEKLRTYWATLKSEKKKRKDNYESAIAKIKEERRGNQDELVHDQYVTDTKDVRIGDQIIKVKVNGNTAETWVSNHTILQSLKKDNVHTQGPMNLTSTITFTLRRDTLNASLFGAEWAIDTVIDENITSTSTIGNVLFAGLLESIMKKEPREIEKQKFRELSLSIRTVTKLSEDKKIPHLDELMKVVEPRKLIQFYTWFKELAEKGKIVCLKQETLTNDILNQIYEATITLPYYYNLVRREYGSTYLSCAKYTTFNDRPVYFNDSALSWMFCFYYENDGIAYWCFSRDFNSVEQQESKIYFKIHEYTETPVCDGESMKVESWTSDKGWTKGYVTVTSTSDDDYKGITLTADPTWDKEWKSFYTKHNSQKYLQDANPYHKVDAERRVRELRTSSELREQPGELTYDTVQKKMIAEREAVIDAEKQLQILKNHRDNAQDDTTKLELANYMNDRASSSKELISLGRKYEYGTNGLPESYEMAQKVYLKAVKSPYTDLQAMCLLGDLSFKRQTGSMRGKPTILGIDWYRKAAESGYEPAKLWCKANKIRY